jgi:hypothetical protein
MSTATLDRGTYLFLLNGTIADYIAKGHDLRSARELAKAELSGAFVCEDAPKAKDDRDECIERW